MNIDQRITLIFQGSPAPIPSLPPTKVFKLRAGQGTLFPYLVFNNVSSPQILTQDQQDVTRVWLYDFSVFATSAKEASDLRQAVSVLFRTIRDNPTNGIQALIEQNRMERDLSDQRIAQAIISYRIIESLQ